MLCVKFLSSFYVTVDVGIFLEATSGMNYNDWYEHDGSLLLHQSLPHSDPNVCEHLYAPITYNDGINLVGTPCTSSKMYYVVCAFQCES